MTLKEAAAAHGDYSRRASENVRFLALAGIGVVWLLCGGKLDGLHQKDLLIIAIALVVVLLLDFGQYVWGAERWDRFIRRVEAKRPRERRTPDSKIQIPPRLLTPIYVLYWAKIWAIVVAYVALAIVMGLRVL